MLNFKDFYHLHPLDVLRTTMLQNEPAFILVAGPDPFPPENDSNTGYLPSGRSTIFQLIHEELLLKYPQLKSVVVTSDRNSYHIPRTLKRRIDFIPSLPHQSFANQVRSAPRNTETALAVDRLDHETLAPILESLKPGKWVLAQCDCIFWGSHLISYLSSLNGSAVKPDCTFWIMAVQRVPGLCPFCRQISQDQLGVELAVDQVLHQLFHIKANPVGEELVQELQGALGKPFFHTAGCVKCNYTGIQGQMAVFDIYRGLPGDNFLYLPSLLPLRAYTLLLASQGLISQYHGTDWESEIFQRTYRLLQDQHRSLNQSQAAFEGKLAELEAANRVLTQRTRSIFAFQEIGQALISFDNLNEMAERVCQRACELCGADRSILYFLRSETSVEVLAVNGWQAGLVHHILDKDAVILRKKGGDPFTFPLVPPGVKVAETVRGVSQEISAGLYVPLISQGETVGAMIIHSAKKTLFTPGERALLRTLANQAALAIQRAGLITDLRKKITELELAQVGLREKERLERELELARQVQQNALPKVFPEMKDFVIAARNEPASEVGGDFYDFIELDQNHFGLAVGDVSGKGLPAAVYMALTRSLLRAEARRQLSPSAVIRSVNQLLLEIGDPSMFVSLFYGVVDRTSRLLSYARAGHDYPVLIRNRQVQLLQGSGAVLGVLELATSDLGEMQLQIECGDRLVLYTDGMTDLISGVGEQYDRGKFVTLLLDKSVLPLEDMCDQVLKFFHDYQAGADPFDDMTIVILQAR